MEKINLTVRIPKEQLDYIRSRAEKMGISTNAYINLLFAKEMGYGKELERKVK